MKRYDCLRAIAPHFGDELVVTDSAARHEWQALRPHPGNYHLQNLGLTSSMALGLALALPHRKVVAFDGDGSLLNLGSLATMATNIRKTLSILSSTTNATSPLAARRRQRPGRLTWPRLRGAAVTNVITAKALAEFEAGFLRALKSNDLYFILAKVEAGAGDVPAAALDSQENKYLFVRYIEKSENLKILTSTLSRAEPRAK